MSSSSFKAQTHEDADSKFVLERLPCSRPFIMLFCCNSLPVAPPQPPLTESIIVLIIQMKRGSAILSKLSKVTGPRKVVRLESKSLPLYFKVDASFNHPTSGLSSPKIVTRISSSMAHYPGLGAHVSGTPRRTLRTLPEEHSEEAF